MPESWGTEIPVTFMKSWKNRRQSIDKGSRMKHKRQWSTKLSQHMDTVAPNERVTKEDIDFSEII